MAKYDPQGFAPLRAALDAKEKKFLSPYAAPSSSGVRRSPEIRQKRDYRQQFAVDVDRILHSLAYSRYIDKTQVFYLIRNDHITHRMLHVQLVSRIARTIGRFLGLNLDLIEAIAIGHDIGHAPFGHDGERILSDLCVSAGIGEFHHNVQSVQFLEKVERKGRGWNLCLQTIDGILCHDGEVHDSKLVPQTKNGFEDIDAAIKKKKQGKAVSLSPMTLEGCVARFADTISYIGRDIEDAIRLGLIKRSELPADCVKILGATNGTIVYTLVTDVIVNSTGRPYLAFSQEVSEALRHLKRFNYERIYCNKAIKKETARIKKIFEFLFERFLNDLAENRQESPVFSDFLDNMAQEYIDSHEPAEIVRDFIAGMTDQYFLSFAPPDLRPKYRRM